MEAFFDLSLGRVMGMSRSGIPFVDIAAYCDLFHVESPKRFVEYIRALDAEFLSWCDERDKAASR